MMQETCMKMHALFCLHMYIHAFRWLSVFHSLLKREIFVTEICSSKAWESNCFLYDKASLGYLVPHNSWSKNSSWKKLEPRRHHLVLNGKRRFRFHHIQAYEIKFLLLEQDVNKRWSCILLSYDKLNKYCYNSLEQKLWAASRFLLSTAIQRKFVPAVKSNG